MRKRVALALGLSGALAATGLAGAQGQDPVTQTIDGSVRPSKLPKNKRVGVRLTVRTKLRAAPGVVTPTATRARILFDDDGTITTRGLPTCRRSRIDGRSTDVAKRVCRRAQVGSGSARALVGGTVSVPVTVTAFNGRPQGRRPMVLLHSAPRIGSPIVLTGVVRRGSGDFGDVLDVTIPPLAGGTGVLTDFTTSVKRTWRFRGRKRHYIAARCRDRNRTFNVRGIFRYDDGSRRVANSRQRCRVRR